MTIIHTYTGKQLDIEAPAPEQLDVRDIAHALSLICRGSGQARYFYSVAQHCLACEREAAARGLSRTVRLACLLHDASEAYMADVPKPIKDNLLPQYRQYEDALLDCIYRKYIGRALTAEERASVAELDRVLLRYDLHFLLGTDTPLPESLTVPDYRFVPTERIETEYLAVLDALRFNN